MMQVRGGKMKIDRGLPDKCTHPPRCNNQPCVDNQQTHTKIHENTKIHKNTKIPHKKNKISAPTHPEVITMSVMPI